LIRGNDRADFAGLQDRLIHLPTEHASGPKKSDDSRDGKRGVARMRRVRRPRLSGMLPGVIVTIVAIWAAPAAGQCVGDCDANGRITIEELVRGVNIALNRAAVSVCPQFDRNASGDVTVDELVAGVNGALRGCIAVPTATPTIHMPTPTARELTSLQSSSPAHGEGDIAVTRETILQFDGALDPASVTADTVFAEFGGTRLAAQRHLSTDRTRLTLFYNPVLPGSARVRVTVNGDMLRDTAGRRIDADRDGTPGGTAQIDFDTLSLAPFPETSVCGRVFASNPAPAQTGEFVNVPLPGVRITVDGMEDEIFAVTDARGDFRLENVPAGGFFVHIDGLAATIAPEGAYYPRVGKMWVSVPGEETNIGEVYLPLITADTLVEVSATEDTVIRIPPSVAEQFPDLADIRITVPANSLYNESGQRGGFVGIAPVDPDRIPSPLPPGLDLDVVVTVQSAGGSDFDAPVGICFPNTEGLAPGDKSSLLSFNHDAGRWEVRGSMTVTEDGTEVCTDPGVGITAPGWHGRRRRNRVKDGPINNGNDSQQEPNKRQPPACPNKDCPGVKKGDQGIGDPVYGFSGEFYEEVEDLRIEGRGIDFVWTRNYRSKIGPNTAQGNGWDFSYNVFIEPDGADLTVCNGTGRIDSYPVAIFGGFEEGQAAGTEARTGIWSRREFFEEMTCYCAGVDCTELCGGSSATVQPPATGQQAAIVQTFQDGGFWEFHLFDGSLVAGKLARSVDRNGNQMRFEYDTMGRLDLVTDTLDRPIVITYNANGFIESVTDFIGRQVRYTYYGAGEAGGSPGDLKTVTTPAVTGTPNGNDFPNGKTWTYTYSTGFSDVALNHNLLTITDPKGQRYLTNVYGTTGVPREPADVVYDRVLRQIWGNPTDTIDFVYGHVTPDSSNSNAMQKTIVRDRVGNVKEYFYDMRNRLVMLREFTGRASTNAPTTETTNRPTGKLRASDPTFFETRHEYNNDSRETRTIHPNGNITEHVYEADLDFNTPPRKRADLRVMRRLPGTHTPAGDQTVIEERYEYDPRFGGLDFVTRHSDARGNVTTHQYDANGNLMHTQHRIASIVEDFEYNTLGQMTAHVRPDNGNGYRRRDEYTYHDGGPQRGYLQSTIIDAATLRLTTAFEHDAVGNTVRITDARGHDTQVIFNQLDQVVRATSREVRDGSGLRHQVDTFYDANDKVVRTDVQNLDENGATQANTHFTTSIDYEILDQPVRVSAEVDPTRSIVTEIAYDANRNAVQMRSGEATTGNQAANRVEVQYDERDLPFRSIRAPGNAAQSTEELDYDRNGSLVRTRTGIEDTPRVTSTVYDAYDRPVSITDPAGNVVSWTYDANDNMVATTVLGERDDQPGGGGNVRLAANTVVPDAMDRPTRMEAAFFDAATQQPIGDGVAATTYEYAGISEVTQITNDNGHSETTTYDTANRPAVITDTAGNEMRYAYDANSNVVSITAIEKSDLGRPQETFINTIVFDNLDRVIDMVDSAGATTHFAYDSRGNVVSMRDALGNVVRSTFDGLNRATEVARELRSGGTGAGSVTGTIRTLMAWDDNSRVVSQTDDLGNATTYTYDPLDRLLATTMADGTRHELDYDVHDNVVASRDANGTAVRMTYDLLDRLSRADVTPGAGVSTDTTFRTFAYDGLMRLIRAADNDSVVQRQYDSLSNMTAETLNGKTTRWTHDGEGNELTLTYPSGRTLARTFDVLERLKSIREGTALIAQYDYIGTDRVERRTYGNGTFTDYGYDTARRTTRTTHRRGATPFDDRSYAWDAMYRKTGITDLLGNDTTTISRDSIYRVTRTARTGAQAGTIDYAYDGAHNRTQVTGGPDAGTYTRDAASPDPADRQVHQYTSTPFDMRTYDRNGNLVSIVPTAASQRTLAYDTANRMVSFQDTATNARYRYDALGRRIEKTVGGVTTQFFSDGIREIEEQDQSGNTIATYVFGNGVDEPLTMERAGTDHFYHADELGSVVALSGGSGATTETYAYDDFGRPAFFDAGGASMPASTAGNAFLFTGRRYDAETGLYEQRTRYFDPRAGRFASGDTIGGWGDHGNLGNSYAYVANDPFTLVDPEGTKPSAYQDFANWARDAFRGEWQRAQQNPLWREMQRHYHKLNGQNWKPAPSNRLYGTKPPSKEYKINYERTPQGMSERLKLMKQPWLEESYLRARERLRLASERFHTKLTRTVPKIPSVKVPCPPKTVKPVRIGAGPLNTRPKIPKLRIPKAPKVPGLNVIIGAGAFIYFMSQGATPAHAISETVEHTQVDYQHYGELVGEHGWIKGTNEYIIEMGESLQPGIDALAPRPGTELPYANMNTKWK
jgi:RHS repeat-associated protein